MARMKTAMMTMASRMRIKENQQHKKDAVTFKNSKNNKNLLQ